jgi:hypothetical protein
VYAGHWSETLDYTDKVRQLSTFLQAGTPDTEREAFCHKQQIVYVLRDRSIYDDSFLPPSRQAAGAFDPDSSPWLSGEYHDGQVSLYRVR